MALSSQERRPHGEPFSRAAALRRGQSGVQSRRIHQPECNPMDPENAPSIILPIAILIAILAACGVIAFALAIVAGVLVL